MWRTVEVKAAECSLCGVADAWSYHPVTGPLCADCFWLFATVANRHRTEVYAPVGAAAQKRMLKWLTTTTNAYVISAVAEQVVLEIDLQFRKRLQKILLE